MPSNQLRAKSLDYYVSRVIRWNSLRYEQVFDANLARSLIEEEMEETNNAQCDVDVLDGCMDLCFVAIGVLWKLGYNPIEVCKLLDPAIEFPEDVNQYTVETVEVFNMAMGIAVHDLGLNADQCLRALGEVCDSNDTKSLPTEKVDPSIKANTNKGPNFRRPEPNLQLILDERNAKLH